jgi:ribokinase
VSKAVAARIVVVGSSNTDLVITAPRLPAPGETVAGGPLFRFGGGKGGNQAVAAVRASLSLERGATMTSAPRPPLP